jgi:hypothetical protein
VPFTINYLSHLISKEREGQFGAPLSVKFHLINNSAFTIPSRVKQFESFDVSFRLSTRQLAERMNEIGSTSVKGTTIHGITGVVSPEMKAEIAGKNFKIENRGPLEQLYIYDDETHWTWHVLPTSSGYQTLKFRLHLLTYENEQEKLNIIDVAHANLAVEANPSEWLFNNWGWIALIALLPIVGWQVKRRFYK